MSARAMLRRSGGVALLLHAFRACLATACVWPLSAALDVELSRHVYAEQLGPGDAALLFQVGLRHAASLPYWACACGLLHLLSTPLLTMVWLHAMLEGRTLGRTLRLALRDYLPALLLGVASLLTLGPVLLPALLLLYWGPPQFPGSEPAQAAVRSGALGAALLAWLTLSVVQDRARAELARGANTLRSAVRRALRALGWSDLAYRAGLALGCALLLATAELTARAASGVLAPPWLAMLLQLLLLPATALQALWLARTLVGAPARRPTHVGGP